MNTRDWPIRAKLTALVIGPVSALLALWIFATTMAFGPALDLLAARTLLYDLGRPGEAVVVELQRERRLSVVQLAGDTTLPALAEQRLRTDRAVAELRRRVAGDDLRDAADDLLDTRLDQLVAALDALPAGRGFIDARQVDRSGAVGLYSGIISSAFQAFSAMATLPDADLNREALALTALGRSRELLGQADALLAGALTAGRFAEGEHDQLVRTIDNQRFLAETAVADLPAAERTAYRRLTEGEAFVRLSALQDALIRADGLPPQLDVRTWETSQAAVQQGLREFELSGADELAERSVPMAARILIRLGAAGVLGLLAIVVCVLVALRVGRSLAGRLTGVRTAALEMAEHRLPDVVARLRRGEEVDVDRRGAAARPTAATRSARSATPSTRCSGPPSRLAVDEVDPAARAQRGLPQHRPAQPGAGAPAAGAAGPDGAAHRGPGRAGGPLPGRPPRHPDAAARRGPGHPRRRGARSGLAQPGAAGRRDPRRGLRGRGLRPGRTSAWCSRPACWAGPSAT